MLETRIATNITKNPIVLGDIDNIMLFPGVPTDLLVEASVIQIGASADLKTAVISGFVTLKDRNKKKVKKSKIKRALIPAVLADTGLSKTSKVVELVRNIKEVNSDYTAVLDDDIIVADASSGELTVTLPSAIGIDGYHFVIKRINSGVNNVVLAADNSETIDGSASQTLGTQYTSLIVVSDGDEWLII